MTRHPLLIAAALALVLAGCGDDDDQAADTAPQATEDTVAQTTEDTVTQATGADQAEVTVVDFAFDPETIDVPVGATVVWSNEDEVPHTVTAGSADEPAEGFDEPLDAGARAEVTFDAAGTFAYYCTFHPDMTAEVVVS